MEEVTLVSLRTKGNLTQRELAQIVNVSPSTIAMYETGDRTPSLEKAKEIAKVFEIPVESIIFGQSAHDMKAKTCCITPVKPAATLGNECKQSVCCGLCNEACNSKQPCHRKQAG